MNGALRGCGLQHVGAIACVVAYLVIAMPLFFALAFRLHLGVTGMFYKNSLDGPPNQRGQNVYSMNRGEAMLFPSKVHVQVNNASSPHRY